MGRYTGPKARVMRRLDAQVFESSGALRAAQKRAFPPGQHTRRRKQTVYGLALAEKQKIKYFYGLRERQLRRYFDKAKRMKGNTGVELLLFCERRLDNVVRRAGFTVTRLQARQAVVHRHFQLNGRTVNKPSIQVRPGDVITIRNRPNLKVIYADWAAQGSKTTNCEWINFDEKALKAVVTAVPVEADISLPLEVGQVVAFMSR